MDAIAAPQQPRRRTAMLYGSETVLLVEDDRQVREVALAILRRHGYAVISACDGDEAVRACEALTDMVMPGITGRELARRLLHIRPGMKVLCMSGYSDADSTAGDAELARLQKPFTAEALATSVRAVLDRGRQPAGSHG